MNAPRRLQPRHARRARPRTARARGSVLLLAAVPVGLLASGLVVWQSTYAAFVSQTDNPGNSWRTGTVTLTDDDAGAAAFTVAEGTLVPGNTGTHCLRVQYTGSLTTAATGVHLYGAASGDTTLAGALNLKVEQGSGGSFADCTGFSPSSTVYDGTLSGFATGHTTYATGYATGWVPVPTTAPAPADSRTYRLTYTLPAGVSYGAAYQGKTTGMTFTWEVQSIEAS